MVIKVFFAVLVLCTTAVVAVILAIHFRVKRHLREESAAAPEVESAAVEEQSKAMIAPPIEGAATNAAEEKLS
ncbi:MAG: hypothetical protein WA655_04850 [Candidatus Korobacteraceae bacterium]